jgi:hypothetical protein
MSTDIQDIDVNLKKRKQSTCLYCGQNHLFHLCKHPDVINFSGYLVNLYKNLYQLPVSLENKYITAYNLLSEYSMNLIVTAGRKTNCYFNKTYGNRVKNLNKKDIIDDLSKCMFIYIKKKYPNLVEGKIDKSFVKSFRSATPSFLLKKKEPSAPPQEDMNLDETNYTDMHNPSAPPMMKTGGKPRRTRKRIIKNKKSKRRH